MGGEFDKSNAETNPIDHRNEGINGERIQQHRELSLPTTRQFGWAHTKSMNGTTNKTIGSASLTTMQADNVPLLPVVVPHQNQPCVTTTAAIAANTALQQEHLLQQLVLRQHREQAAAAALTAVIGTASASASVPPAAGVAPHASLPSKAAAGVPLPPTVQLTASAIGTASSLLPAVMARKRLNQQHQLTALKRRVDQILQNRPEGIATANEANDNAGEGLWERIRSNRRHSTARTISTKLQDHHTAVLQALRQSSATSTSPECTAVPQSPSHCHHAPYRPPPSWSETGKEQNVCEEKKQHDSNFVPNNSKPKISNDSPATKLDQFLGIKISTKLHDHHTAVLQALKQSSATSTSPEWTAAPQSPSHCHLPPYHPPPSSCSKVLEMAKQLLQNPGQE